MRRHENKKKQKDMRIAFTRPDDDCGADGAGDRYA
jgi:hypothetical protein